jgi:ketosteroid isomerase-like protein
MNMRLALVLTATMFSVPAPQAQKADVTADAAAIRALLDAGQTPMSADAIFWSGAYPRPMVGAEDRDRVKPFPEGRIEQRTNQKRTNDLVRLEVAASGDLAYEFSNFSLSYDLNDTTQHVAFTGSVLRVWKKVNGQWRVAAAFLRPHDVPFASPRRQ